MDWMLPQQNFGSPRAWRHFVLPALIALGLNFAVLALLRWPVFKKSPQITAQRLQVKLQPPQTAKQKTPEAAVPGVQEPPRVEKRAVTSPAAPIPNPAPHVERQSQSRPAITHAKQPVVTRQKLYDSARQVIDAMSEAKARRIPMSDEIPEIPRQFRHTKMSHKLLAHQWESQGASLYLRNGQCFTDPRLASQAGIVALPMEAQRFVHTMLIKASGIKCPWDDSHDEPFHFHIHPFKNIHPLKKPARGSR